MWSAAHQCKTYTTHNNEQIVQHYAAQPYQCTDACCLCGLRFGVFPDQEQYQTYDGDTAAQQTPQKTAVVGALRCLRHTAIGTNDRFIIDLSSAVFTISLNFYLSLSDSPRVQDVKFPEVNLSL